MNERKDLDDSDEALKRQLQRAEDLTKGRYEDLSIDELVDVLETASAKYVSSESSACAGIRQALMSDIDVALRAIRAICSIFGGIPTRAAVPVRSFSVRY
jgi:hypothetical protein